jgi:hypothetical protein
VDGHGIGDRTVAVEEVGLESALGDFECHRHPVYFGETKAGRATGRDWREGNVSGCETWDPSEAKSWTKEMGVLLTASTETVFW